MYRSREWQQEERQFSKSKKTRNWWYNENAKIQYKSVLFVTLTPDGVLAKDVQMKETELDKNSSERILVVEKWGLKVKEILGQKKTFKKINCVLTSCPLCTKSEYVEKSTDKVKIPCNTANVGNRWICLTCQDRNIVKSMRANLGDLPVQSGRAAV